MYFLVVLIECILMVKKIKLKCKKNYYIINISIDRSIILNAKSKKRKIEKKKEKENKK